MNCYNCGTENTDNSLFCKNCGKRLDGTIACPSCGERITSDSLFCNFCGVKLTSVQEDVAATAQPEAAVKEKPSGINIDKVLSYSATVAALTTAVFSLIFVFFIGVVATYTYSGMSASEQIEKANIFYYFGKAYKNVGKTLDSFTEFYQDGYSDFFESTRYLLVIFGTIIYAITVITVCVFSVLSIVRCVKTISGKETKSGDRLAVAAFISLVAGAVLLLALTNYNVHYENGYNTEISNVKFNKATYAGISLGAISAIVCVCCTVARHGKKLLSLNTILKFALSVLGLALIIVVLTFCSRPVYSLETEEMSSNDYGYVGIMYLISALGFRCLSFETYAAIINADKVKALCIIAFILLIVTVILSAVVLVNSVNGATKRKTGAELVVSILLSVFALAFLIFTIITANEFTDALDYAGRGDKMSFGYTVPIVVLVMSVLILVVDIVQYKVVKKEI